jgi:hypothetical protein
MSSINLSSALGSNVSSTKDAVLLKKAGNQQASVVATLLQGVAQTPRPASAPTGQVLNVKA